MVGDDATAVPTPPRGDGGCCSSKGRCALKCLWSPVQVSGLVASHSKKKEKNGDHVGCTASFVDRGGQTTTMQCQCQSRPWSDLPNDLLFSIASRLGGADDFIRFMNVCKGWLDSIKPHGGHRNRMPCLLAMEKPDLGWLSLYTPFPNSKTYKLRIPELKETAFRFSKDGWILLSKSFIGGPFLFLFNLSTGAKFDLPNLSIPISYGGVCFTSTPGSSDFMVFAIRAVYSRSITIFTYRPSTDPNEEQTWTIIDCDETNRSRTTPTMDVSFFGVSCNPVFYKGEFYCLDNYGHLGAFNPDRKIWRIVTGKPNNFEDWRKLVSKFDNFIPLYSPRIFPYKSFMVVDLKGDLISVFVFERKTAKDVHIFRLDDSCSKMGWEKVNSLGTSTGGQLFVGLSTSISTVQVPHDDDDDDDDGSSCNNCNLIYFPGFKTNHLISDNNNDDINNSKGKKAWTYYYESYSLKTKEFDDRPSRGCLWRDPFKFTWIELPMSKWESIFYSKWESICYSKCK